MTETEDVPDNQTHHLVPRTKAGFSILVCAYCGVPAQDLGPDATQQLCPQAP